MPTIRDIAIKANVSTATVSNVINGTAKVKDDTRARVLQALAEIEVNRNNDNKLEKEQNILKSNVIGVITEDVCMFNTPKIINGICAAAHEAGYSTIISNLGITNGSENPSIDEVTCIQLAKSTVNLLLSKNLKGIIYVGCQSREIKHISSGYKTPFVYAYCYSNDNHAPSVIYDDENIAYQLIKYLTDKNHRNIGIIAGPEDSIHVRDRLSGYQRAVFESGILFNPNGIVYGDWENPQTGYMGVKKLLEKNITAVFCMNDIIAGGVIDYALENNIAIPKQLSVVGFDNIEASRAYFPKLTTVALPLDEIGRKSFYYLNQLILDKNYVCDPNVFVTSCEIIHRDSVDFAP